MVDKVEFTKGEFGHYIHHIPYWSGHLTDETEEDVYTHLTQQFGIEIKMNNFVLHFMVVFLDLINV